MNGAPLVSIIVTAYNAERYLSGTLDSILAQTLADWECVVVDDGSKDGTVAVGQKYAALDERIRVLQQDNKGVSAARNHGYRKTCPSSRYVLFMDGDDVFEKDALALLTAAAKDYPHAAGAHGLAELIDEEGNDLNPGTFSDYGRSRVGFDGRDVKPWELSEPTNFNTLIIAFQAYPPGLVLVSRNAMEKAGLFDEQLGIPGRTGEDWDMLIRLSRYGDFRFVNRVIIRYRRHRGNISGDNRKNIIWSNYVRYKTYFSPENSVEQRKLVRKAYRALQRHKMKEKLHLVRDHREAGRYTEVAKMVLHVAGLCYRYLRGFPRPRG